MITVLGLGSIGSLLSCKLRLNSCRLNVISRLSRNAEINYKEYNGLEHTIKGFEGLSVYIYV